MPTLSRLFLRTSLVYLAVGLITGVLFVAGPSFGLPISIPGAELIYVHLLTVGWITQLIFGVVYWMFPKYSAERPRGSETLAWMTYGLINAGLLLRVISEPLAVAHPRTGWGWLLALSAILQLLAGWAFIANTWARVKER